MSTSRLAMLLPLLLFAVIARAGDKPFHSAELIFPMEHWHNHASMVVESTNGDLLVCWFHGSGERTADDVKVEGARLKKGEKKWSPRFTMADTPGYPDTNCTMFVDPQNRLWLLWPTILANQWESALMKYKIASDWKNDGEPRWEKEDVLHVTPGQEFVDTVNKAMDDLKGTNTLPAEYKKEKLDEYITRMKKMAGDKLTRRLGWMTRAHPIVIDNKRLIVPLYSDGFSISLMAITDDWGKTWHTSKPLVGGGNIQPSVVRKKDGTLFTLMRDNGPPPKRLHQSESKDNGETWSPVVDSILPNPGSGAEIINLKNGEWAIIYNDTENGRHSLAVSISEDEGKSWKWTRHLEQEPSGNESSRFHYPSLMQSRDGSLHATYSYHLNKKVVELDQSGKEMRKSIKHAHFNIEWVKAGDQKIYPGP